MASPRPVPPKRRVVEASPWVKSSKIRGRRSAGIPMPVSRTRISMPRFGGRARRTEISTEPRSVNFTALPSRLMAIWRMRTGSPANSRGRSGG